MKHHPSDDASILIEVRVNLVHGSALRIKPVIDQNGEFPDGVLRWWHISVKWCISTGVIPHRRSIDQDATPDGNRAEMNASTTPRAHIDQPTIDSQSAPSPMCR